jgi:hypothetical protein
MSSRLPQRGFDRFFDAKLIFTMGLPPKDPHDDDDDNEDEEDDDDDDEDEDPAVIKEPDEC